MLGRPVGEMEARRYWDEKTSLLDVVVGAYRDLRARFDVVICEGAGSPAEINLRAVDIVNLGFARAVDAPVVVVSRHRPRRDVRVVGRHAWPCSTTRISDSCRGSW